MKSAGILITDNNSSRPRPGAGRPTAGGPRRAGPVGRYLAGGRAAGQRVTPEPGRGCPCCGSETLWRSRVRWYESPYLLALVRPLRCASCYARFWRRRSHYKVLNGLVPAT